MYLKPLQINMREVQEDQLRITEEQKGREASLIQLSTQENKQPTTITKGKNKWWLKVAMYTIFTLCGQSTATLLGKLYYKKGGNLKWVVALLQVIGFPIQLIPYYFIKSSKRKVNLYSKRTIVLVLAVVYMTLGLLIAVVCFLTSLGIKYLPLSTFTLISASQLGFTAVFSFFLNSQKFTPFIVNSIVLLSLSSVLLVFNPGSAEPNEISKGKYVMGFIFTICASAGTGFMLTFTQFVLQKVIKSESFEAVMNLIIYESLAATCGILVGVFASKEWKALKREVEKFELGSTCYIMILTWTAISWQLFAIGSMGLIYETCSVFCNVISTLGLPVVPLLAVIVVHEKITGLMVIAMLLAIWGFVSYVYQHYLDHYKSRTEDANDINEVNE